jgi:serine/threonine protein kinase
MSDSGTLSNWRVVCQSSQNGLVLYNPFLQQLRTVQQSDSRKSLVPWTSPRYWQILADILARTVPRPTDLNDFAMNGYFDKFFPVRHLIGRGGCGSVYRVEHKLADIALAVMAVKIIPVGHVDYLKKVVSEVQLLQRFSEQPHPLLLGYKHCWIEEWQTATFGPKVPCLFILMDFAPLGNTEGWVSGITDQAGHYRPLTDTERWQIFLNIVVAVRHLHSLGILHRDVKLSNVLGFRDDAKMPLPVRLVLSDFGTAIDLIHRPSGARRTGATGTIETMAPELLVTDDRGAYVYAHSFQSDIWSLGVILFTLFFGCNPFVLEGGEERLRQFRSVNEVIAELGLDGAKVPPIVLRYIRRMMRGDPGQRCSLEELLRDSQIFGMIVEFGLNDLVQADGPRAFVASPSMEDLMASEILPLTDQSERRAPEISATLVVALVGVAMCNGVAAVVAYAVLVLAVMRGATGDLEAVAGIMLVAIAEMAVGAARRSIPVIVLFLYILFAMRNA